LSRRTQTIVIIVTSIGLLVATVWAWRAVDISLSQINWLAVAGAFFLAATLALKMLEFDAGARIVGQRVSFRRAYEIAVVASAANLLPIPGSLIVTTRAFSEQGATYGSAAIASTLPGLAWLGLSGIIAGFAIVVTGAPIAGGVVVTAGVLGFLATGVLFMRRAPERGRARLAIRIVVIEGGWVLLAGFRFWLVLTAIGTSATAAQSIALALAGAMSVAVGFFPGGFGAREAFIALLSPIISLPLADGVLVGVIDRVIWLTFISLAALVLVSERALRHKRSTMVAIIDDDGAADDSDRAAVRTEASPDPSPPTLRA